MRTLQVLALLSMAFPGRAADEIVKLPPVLRNDGPTDSVIVTLPGSAPRVVTLPAPQPTPVALPTETKTAETPKAELSKKSLLPPELQREVALFCQKLIGQWTEEDAEQIFGKPLRNRASYDEKKQVNGRIFAFPDPSGRYRELELDFEQVGGTLRTVFAYPKGLTWQDCRKRWNGEVSEADAKQGRTFYSYLNRRMDVLVDARGKVISLGLY